MHQTVDISKLDAAYRQTETAIKLYFDTGDPASIHTLAGAASLVLKDLSSKSGQKTFIERSVGRDLFKLLTPVMRTPQNFLKHADKDPDSVLQLSPGAAELLLLDCVTTYSGLTGEEPPIFLAFAVWLGLNNPEFYSRLPEHFAMFSALKGSVELNRKSFLAEFLSSMPPRSEERNP